MSRKFEATFVTFAARDRQVIEVPDGENIHEWVEQAMFDWMWENYAPEFQNLQEITGDNNPED